MNSGFSGMELFRLIASTVFVLALLAALLYFMKRMQNKIGSTSHHKKMQLTESLSLSARQKVACIQMDGHTVLIGIGPSQLSCLAHWKNDSTGIASPTNATSTFSLSSGDHRGT
jgi:flagellar biogenesis protein FliO